MADDPASSGRDQAGRFKPGASGNPSGPKPGYHHRTTKLAMDLLGKSARALINKAISMALNGDGLALRLCLDRIAPPPKPSRFVTVDLPLITSASDLVAASAAVVAAVAAGKIALEDAEVITRLIEAHVAALTAQDHEPRIIALERMARLRAAA
jgi:hypothetical protein